MRKTAKAFEEYLLTNGFLKIIQLEEIRKKAAETRQRFKAVCLSSGAMKEDIYMAAEAEFLEIPQVRLSELQIDQALLQLVPLEVAKKKGVLPIAKNGNILTVAVFDPYDIFLADALQASTHLEIKFALATETDVWQHIQKYYQTNMMQDAVKTFQMTARPVQGDTAQTGQFQLDFRKLISGAGHEAPVVKLVDHTILQAVQDRASDIHIEPESDFIRVRYRIDGVLIEAERLPKDVQNPVASRIKIMAKLDIAEHRKPQDGKIQMNVSGKEIDIRVSSYPTTYGENLVLRILDKSNSMLDLNQLGFTQNLRKDIDALLKYPYGIILVTGPTGAGKTTTLYAALQAINVVDRNIMTIEDPIEYQISMIRQSQVNPKAGLTFATGLRSLLRQDPDVMLIGEIRDRETAEIAIESALTGHLVFATLHTNDAAGAITRLQDMGIETFLISCSLIGVVAQRLVRRLCPDCKEEVPAAEMHLTEEITKALLETREYVRGELQNVSEGPLVLYKGHGCQNCKKIGYKGRLAIYELMIIDDRVRQLMAARSLAAEIRKYAFTKTRLAMRRYGFTKALSGETTIEEVLKVVQSD